MATPQGQTTPEVLIFYSEAGMRTVGYHNSDDMMTNSRFFWNRPRRHRTDRLRKAFNFADLREKASSEASVNGLFLLIKRLCDYLFRESIKLSGIKFLTACNASLPLINTANLQNEKAKLLQ
jgi:hypothetical protein